MRYQAISKKTGLWVRDNIQNAVKALAKTPSGRYAIFDVKPAPARSYEWLTDGGIITINNNNELTFVRF